MMKMMTMINLSIIVSLYFLVVVVAAADLTEAANLRQKTVVESSKAQAYPVTCPCWNDQVLQAIFPSLKWIRLSVGREGANDDVFDLPTYRMETCKNEGMVAIVTGRPDQDAAAKDQDELQDEPSKQCVYTPDSRIPMRQLEGTPLSTHEEYVECVRLLKDHFQNKLGGVVHQSKDEDDHVDASWDYYQAC
mmetsp:Transcript_5463/g.10266  ORF Transcript_5463/g.10266 Transcript_5463/m.10266 type:complete len:191 (-) Transcript_5463:240-812(-)